MRHVVLHGLFDLALLFGGGLALLATLRLAAFLFRVAPVPARIRGALQRFAPVLGLAAFVVYVASGLALLLLRDPEFAGVLVVVLSGLLVFAWAPLYDLVAGVAFRFGRWCREGDQVRIGDVEGRILAIGMRSLVVQTRQGDQAVVPYGKMIRETIRRTQSVSGAHVHAFVVDLPDREDFSAVKRGVIQTALRCHWASVVHPPKVERREGDAVEISIYALDADHAPRVEAAVRAYLSTQPTTALFG